MYTSIQQGGVGLLDINAQQKALKLKALNHIISPQVRSPAKYFSLYWIRQKLATLFPNHFYLLVDNSQSACSLFNYNIPLFHRNSIKVLKENKQLCALFKNTTFSEEENTNREISNKQIYNCIMESAQKLTKFEHTCVRLYHDNYIGLCIKWENMWLFSFKTYSTNRKYEVTWSLRHHVLNTGDRIHKMYPHLKPKCQTCQIPGTERILHAFVECKFVRLIWQFFQSFFTKILDKEFSHYEL